MKHHLVTLAIIATIFYSVSDGLQYSDCGSKSGKFTKILISGCDTTSNECILKRNSSASITIDFTLSENVSAVKTVVHGKILGMDFPFALKNPDGCVDSGLKCPLEKYETYEYLAVLPVLQSYPKVKVLVKWELKDQNDVDIVCVLVPAKIE